MLPAIFSNYLILLSVFGYSLIFLSILQNFFFPLKYFTIPVIVIGVIFFLIGVKKKYFFIKIYQYELIIFITLIINIIFWMQAPEIKYAWRMFFILPFFFILIYIKNRFFSKIVNFSHNFFLGTFLIILLLFFSKSLRFFKIENFLSAQGRQHDFSKIQKIGIFNNMEIYYNFWKCADYALACVYFPKDKYNINQRYSRAFFENDLF